MKKSILLSCLLSISVCANAYPMNSGPFYLPGGIVSPKSQYVGLLRIPLTSLPQNVTFDITCDIENPNYYKPYPVVIVFWNGSLNGVTSPSNQYLLNHEISKYASRVRVDDHHKDLMFENYDTVDSVNIKNCIAVYATTIV